MGAMSQLAAENAEEINILHWEYQEAWSAYNEYLDAHPPARRTLEQFGEVVRLEAICTLARYAYEKAEERKYKI